MIIKTIEYKIIEKEEDVYTIEASVIIERNFILKLLKFPPKIKKIIITGNLKYGFRILYKNINEPIELPNNNYTKIFKTLIENYENEILFNKLIKEFKNIEKI